VRPSTKLYGKGNKIEGFLKKKSTVLIIEDHVSTGASIVNNACTVRESGSSANICIATTTYQTKESILLLNENKISLYYLTTGNDIIKYAFIRKVIKQKEMEIIKKWFNNPRDWM
jgi:orotate phosphoribosyltransferase